jgi:predicted porin
MVSQSNAFTPTGGSIGSKNGLGISLFGSYNIIPELAVVGRYDYFDPNTNSAANAKGDVRNYVIAGLSWKVDKNVSIMPNLLYETYEAIAGHGEPDPSVTARVTLYYVFL